MNQLNDLPGDTLAGQSFNYTVWTAGTQVMLCTVPWNIDYRDIVNFANSDALDAYLNANAGPRMIFEGMTFAKPGVPIKINLPYSACYAFNYLRVHNDAILNGSGAPRTFYYFITDITYIAPNTTQINVQLDVWQSFGRDITFGNCYVERGHVGIADTNSSYDHGRYSLTVPEGLDMGNEYQICNLYEHTLAQGSADYRDGDSYDILVWSTTVLEQAWGDVSAPLLNTAQGSAIENMPNGMNAYWFTTGSSFMLFMSQVSVAPWISQGIVSIMAVPPLNDWFTPTSASGVFSDDGKMLVCSIPGSTIKYWKLNTGLLPQKLITLAGSDWRTNLQASFGYNYRNLKKFCTYPYSVVELTTYAGTPILLKPECIASDSLQVIQSTHLALPSPRIAFSPYQYNKSQAFSYSDLTPVDGGFGTDGGEYMDMSTMISNFPMYSIVNNSYLGYLASNKNSIAYQHSSADWSQQRALTGANAEASNANQAIWGATATTGANQEQVQNTAQLNYDTATSQAIINGGVNALNGIGSMAGGNVVGGAISAIGGAAAAGGQMLVNQNQIIQQAGINNQALSGRNQAARNQMSGVRDTNLTYAQYAAKGDYANAIAAINAKVQDAKLIQPTTSGQLGGEAFMLSTFRWGVFAKVKIMADNAINQIGDFWLRYGYAVNRFINLQGSPPIPLSVMTKFTYWKMRETYIISTGVPEGFRQSIRGIFEKGVTVWNAPTDIGSVSIYDNEPIGGIAI